MVSRLPAHELRACIAAPCARTSCIILVQHVRPCTQHKPKYLHATQGPRKFSVGQYDYRQSFILRKCEPLQCVEQNVVRHLQQTLIQFGSAASSTHTLAFCSTNHSTTFTQPLAAASCTALLYTYEIKVNLVQHDQLPVNFSLLPYTPNSLLAHTVHYMNAHQVSPRTLVGPQASVRQIDTTSLLKLSHFRPQLSQCWQVT